MAIPEHLAMNCAKKISHAIDLNLIKGNAVCLKKIAQNSQKNKPQTFTKLIWIIMNSKFKISNAKILYSF